MGGGRGGKRTQAGEGAFYDGSKRNFIVCIKEGGGGGGGGGAEGAIS